MGVGAVGSFLADLLARSGVGRLTLVDGDSMRVGNSVRHLLGPSYANQPKVYAVARSLAERALIPADAVTAVDRPVTPEVLWDLFSRCDIVVDATAAPDVRAMFEHLGKVAGEQWVEVALYRSGALARADRLGPGTASAIGLN